MLAIYRRELKSYFTSVIACLFIAVTTLIAGIFFVYYNLSYGVSEMYSVYQCLLILVFTVPILTMKVIADERRQKTDQLILTAPVSVGKIVVGKFFALETIYAIPVFVMCLYPLILSSFGTVSFKTSYTNIFGKTKMKKKLVVALISAAMVTSMLGACGSSNASSSSASSTATSSVSASSASEEDTTAASSSVSASSASEEVSADADQEAADKVAALIDAIYVQERNDNTDEQCKEAKEAWDALTDAQKELVEGENADPDYFGRDTGDASKDDPLNGDEIGENELLVVSFGTSFNDSRAEDVKGIEDALAEAYPDWSVRRAFTAQIIINHVQARDDEKIDNMDQALERAVDNGVKNLVVQPTHLMHGAEYDELTEAVENYKDKFESVKIAEPLLGEVGANETAINEDKAAVAEAITAEAVKTAGFDSLDAAKEEGTAFVFMGHGTSHTAKISYSQMQAQMEQLGYENVFIGTVEGEPEDTACEAVIEKLKDAGYKKVILRPLMVVAGDHANNDMAGDDDDSWKSQFEASGAFDSIDTQIAGLGEIDAIQQLYVAHTQAAIDAE